jgi:hypothetical protein
VQHGESALKLLLRLGRARGLKLNAPESIRVGDWIMLLCKGRASESGCRAETDGSSKHYSDHRRLHAAFASRSALRRFN